MTSQSVGQLHEHDANQAIAQWLNGAGRDWRADAERASVLADSAARPDIVVRQVDRMPVIVECEYDSPAVEDAKRRLGERLRGDRRPFSAAIAVGISADCRGDSVAQFARRLDADERVLSIRLVSGDSADEAQVWPDAPMACAPSDLAAYCEYMQAPQATIDRQSERIAERIMSMGEHLHGEIELTVSRSAATFAELRRATGTDNDMQAARTACAIWLIAIDLQNDLAKHNSDLQAVELPSTDDLKARTVSSDIVLKAHLLEAWRLIQGVNYLPVMELAISALNAGELGDHFPRTLAELAQLSDEITSTNAKHVYNFAGELWQRLVPDREERAAHYTRPAIAELLATLSAARFGHMDAAELAALNLWDAACGTGTLIGAGERTLRRLHSQKGGADPELHRKRMEEHIIALDVNGIVGTLTAKRLTDLNIAQDYNQSKIAVVTDGAGSLFLLDPSRTTVSDFLGGGGRSVTPGMDGIRGLFGIPPRSVHWALMNPPYSRPRKGRQQAARGLAPLRNRASRRSNGRGYNMSNGQAGLASDFSNIANMRLAPGGVYAFVLPLTAAHAESWRAWRSEMETDFQDIVAIANAGREEESMSADTNMNEMLVVATKKALRPGGWQPTRITAVNFHQAPSAMEQGYAAAQEIAAIAPDSAQGRITHGNYVISATISEGFPWFAVGNASYEFTAVIAALLNGKCWDPLTFAEFDLALTMGTLGQIAEAGPTHHLIGHRRGNDAIGAFEWSPMDEWDIVPTHTAMWAAEGKRQTSIAALPTDGGHVVDAAQAARLSQATSSCFFKRGLRWTSQATAVCATASAAHGGAAWNALQNIKRGAEPAIALFYNSIFGAALRSAYGQSTQSGRSTIQVNAIAGTPCPDFGAGTDAARRAIEIAAREFEALSALELEPFAYCFRDGNRQRIDSVVADMLGLDAADAGVQALLARYRLLFAREPNVNGRNRGVLGALEEMASG